MKLKFKNQQYQEEAAKAVAEYEQRWDKYQK